jgi:hypothetical protein
MSRRRTCCCEGGEGDVCFKFAVNAKHLQYCTLTCVVIPCVVYRDESCPASDSFGVANTYTRALGTLQPQQFVVSRAGETCSCGIPCVYTWTPPENSWDTSICFKMNGLGGQCFGCPEIIDSNPVGSINVILGGPLTCPQVCGCCGTGTRFVSIEYSRTVPEVTVQGDCGDVVIGGLTSAWTTSYTAQYCWDVSNPCTMTLFRIFAGSNAYFAPSYGPDAFAGDNCDCGTNTSNGCDTSTSGSNCYPNTGDWATLYAAAGSPPATLNCGSCKC